MTCRAFVFSSIAALALTACTSPTARTKAALKDRLDSLVAAHPGWHVGRTADCKNQYLAQVQREEPGYEPYRATGDFDRDGINDVAVVLLRGDSGVIVWLPGVSSGYAAPLAIDSLSWASNGGLYANHDTLGFGVFYSDVFRSWAWDSAARTLRPASHTPGSPEP